MNPLFIPHALLLLFIPISLHSGFTQHHSCWSPSLFSTQNLIYSTLLFPPPPNSISFFPHISLAGITMQTSPSTGVSHEIIMISTPCFLVQVHHSGGGGLDTFVQFHTLHSIWGLTFCAATDISLAAGWLSGAQTASARVTVERQRCGVVARTLCFSIRSWGRIISPGGVPGSENVKHKM